MDPYPSRVCMEQAELKLKEGDKGNRNEHNIWRKGGDDQGEEGVDTADGMLIFRIKGLISVQHSNDDDEGEPQDDDDDDNLEYHIDEKKRDRRKFIV